MSHPKIYKFKPDNPESQTLNDKYFATKDALWGDAIYIYSNNTGNTTPTQNLQTVIERLSYNATNYYQKMLDEKFPNTWLGNLAHTHLTGIYSPSYLSQGRISPEIPGLFTEIIYNPYTDKGKGNRIWVDYCTKGNNLYTAGQSKCLLEDMPLWTLVFGYHDWVKKELNNWVISAQARVLIVSPYTVPKLYHENNTKLRLCTIFIQIWRGTACLTVAHMYPYNLEASGIPQYYTSKQYLRTLPDQDPSHQSKTNPASN